MLVYQSEALLLILNSITKQSTIKQQNLQAKGLYKSLISHSVHHSMTITRNTFPIGQSNGVTHSLRSTAFVPHRRTLLNLNRLNRYPSWNTCKAAIFGRLMVGYWLYGRSVSWQQTHKTENLFTSQNSCSSHLLWVIENDKLVGVMVDFLSDLSKA